MQLDIAIEKGAWQALERPRRNIRRSVLAALEAAGRPADDVELSVALWDDERVRELNRIWRGKDKATNVLSFPAASPKWPAPGQPLVLGDVALAAGVVLKEAEEQGKTVSAHVCHLVVHAVLHLLGYDHSTEETAAGMEDIERRALALLGLPDPYADSGADELRRAL